jgi:hypothetical protein
VTVVTKLNSRKHVEQELEAAQFDFSDACSGRCQKAIDSKVFTGVSVNFQNLTKAPSRTALNSSQKAGDSIVGFDHQSIGEHESVDECKIG